MHCFLYIFFCGKLVRAFRFELWFLFCEIWITLIAQELYMLGKTGCLFVINFAHNFERRYTKVD